VAGEEHVQPGRHRVAGVEVAVEGGGSRQYAAVDHHGLGDVAASFIDRDLLREKVLIGPGIVNLRFTGSQVPGLRGACQLVAYSAFTVPATAAEGPMAEFAKQQEVEFKAAGFGVKMSPDEYVVLAPSKYVNERALLGGLFFTNFDGTVFAARGKRPERKVSVRIFVLVCTAINY